LGVDEEVLLKLGGGANRDDTGVDKVCGDVLEGLRCKDDGDDVVDDDGSGDEIEDAESGDGDSGDEADGGERGDIGESSLF